VAVKVESAAPERFDIRRQAIVDAAVELANTESLAGVTMRAVAARLGVGTMTLYSYVPSKEELIDLMVDEANSAMLVAPPLPGYWRDALRAIALRTREAFEQHPWMFDAPPLRVHQRINFLRHVEQSLEAVASLGLDHETNAALLSAVDDYTLGHTLRSLRRKRIMRNVRVAAAHAKPAPDTARELDPAIAAALEAGELPRLKEVFGGGVQGGARSRPLMPPQADFERGLDWLLDGIEAWLPPGSRRG
jgi:AcrR family transcriptional regulator